MRYSKGKYYFASIVLTLFVAAYSLRSSLFRKVETEETLEKWFSNYKKGPVVMKWEAYLDLYERYFSKFRGKNVTMLEIGVQSGGSIKMWQSYFGPKLNFIGFDINAYCKRFEGENVRILTGSQLSRADLYDLRENIGHVDIILDDGGHTYSQQIITTESLLPHIKDGGLIVVEDTHTSYMEGFGDVNFSFIEYVKEHIDKINMRFGRFEKNNS